MSVLPVSLVTSQLEPALVYMNIYSFTVIFGGNFYNQLPLEKFNQASSNLSHINPLRVRQSISYMVQMRDSFLCNGMTFETMSHTVSL
jgi:hypothetical protein